MGINFSKVIEKKNAIFNFAALVRLVESLGQIDSPRHLLTSICLFLHLRQKDVTGEISLCGVCANRLIIGEWKRQELCETREYHQSPFYQYPRQNR